MVNAMIVFFLYIFIKKRTKKNDELIRNDFFTLKNDRETRAELRFVPQIDNSVYYIEQGSI